MTTFWYESDDAQDPFLQYLVDIQDNINPPFVSSISYSVVEAEVPASELSSFETEAMKVAVMGLTVLVASGDDGVGGEGSITFNGLLTDSQARVPVTTLNKPPSRTARVPSSRTAPITMTA